MYRYDQGRIHTHTMVKENYIFFLNSLYIGWNFKFW